MKLECFVLTDPGGSGQLTNPNEDPGEGPHALQE